MASVDLATLIKDTQNQQKQDLVNFQKYINLSTQLKANVGDRDNPAATFIDEVLQAFFEGKQSDLSVPANTSLAALWNILLNNKDYLALLEQIDLPENGTADERMATLVNYLNNRLSND